MILLTKGDLFDSDCDAFVNATNPQGAMAGGIAAAFAQQFPRYERNYILRCKRGEEKLGVPHFYREYNSVWLVSIATMNLGQGAQYGAVRNGLLNLREEAVELGIGSVAIPALGCGIGGLEWPTVRGYLQEIFSTERDLVIKAYAPL